MWIPSIGHCLQTPRRVTCELSHVCWLKRCQHNMQHMQVTRGGKSLSRAQEWRFRKRSVSRECSMTILCGKEGNIIKHRHLQRTWHTQANRNLVSGTECFHGCHRGPKSIADPYPRPTRRWVLSQFAVKQASCHSNQHTRQCARHCDLRERMHSGNCSNACCAVTSGK